MSSLKNARLMRVRVVWVWCALVVVLGLGEAAIAQVRLRVETREGRTLIGEATLGEGEISIKGGGGEVTKVPAPSVLRIAPAPRTEPKVMTARGPASSRPATMRSHTPGLLGQYYNGVQLSEFVFERVDTSFQFDGRGRDEGQLEVDDLGAEFSVRWSGYIEAPVSGEYRIFLKSDDGARLWIDNTSVVDKWGPMVLETEGKVRLEAGKRYPFVLEYMDIGGGQHMSIEWEAEGLARQAIPPGALTVPDELDAAKKGGAGAGVWPGSEKRGGWKVEYFAGLGMKDLKGMRTEIPLRLDWENLKPVEGLPDAYSARVTGRLYPDATGEFRFRSSADDRIRIFFDGKKVLDTFEDKGFDKEFSASLTKGKAVNVLMEYENDIGPGYIKLAWKRPAGAGAGVEDFRAINSGNVGLPEGEETGPLARVDTAVFPRRAGPGTPGKDAIKGTGRVWFPPSANGAKCRAEWVDSESGKVLATSKPDSDGVVTVDLQKLPAGKHKLFLRATDAKGRVAESNTATTEIEGVNETGLEGPWADARVTGGGEEPKKLKLVKAEEVLSMSAEGGDILGSEDRFRFLSQTVNGEAAVTARLMGVSCDPAGTYVVGGLMVRVGTDQSHPYVAVVVDAAGKAAVLYRKDHGGEVQSVPIEMRAGMYARISRERDSIRVLVSEEGKSFRGVWSLETNYGDNASMGAFVVTRGASATMKLSGLSIRRGGMAVSEGRGVMLTSGTFLAGEARIGDTAKAGEGRIMVRNRDTAIAVSRGAIAYIAFARMTAQQIELMNRRAPSALLRRDDVVEGELSQLRDDGVSIESVLFGEQRYNIYNGDIRGLCLRPFAVKVVTEGGSGEGRKGGVTVLVKGGTVLRGVALRVGPGGFGVEGTGLPAEYKPVEPGEVTEVRCEQ